MLRKLMKHEFRATGRIMLPLYLILLATSLGANLSARGLLNTRYRILDMLGVLLVMAFGIAIFAVCIMSVVVMVQRFYKNLLQDEGYVMLTLPVSVHQQVWSKLIVSAVWFAATVVMVIAAACIVAFDIDFIKYFFQGVGELLGDLRKLEAYYAVNGTAIVAEGVVLCFLACCAMCLQFYAALAAGPRLCQPQDGLVGGVLLHLPVRHADGGLRDRHFRGRHKSGLFPCKLCPLRFYGRYARGADLYDRLRGDLRRHFLWYYNVLLEKAAEPGVNCP